MAVGRVELLLSVRYGRLHETQQVLMNTVLPDGNVYDKLRRDAKTRATLQACVDRGLVRVIATLTVLDELRRSPFGGIPAWYRVAIESENVTVLNKATLGVTRLGEGAVYYEHCGKSRQVPDAIIADSANALADILVSEDRRCRERLKRIGTRCKGMDYEGFCGWLRTITAAT